MDHIFLLLNDMLLKYRRHLNNKYNKQQCYALEFYDITPSMYLTLNN